MFKVCVVEKVCGFVVCWFSFCFFCFFGEGKERGGAQNSLSPSLRTESDSFSPKKIRKNVSNQSSLHTSLFVIEPSRALTNAPFEHARKHTHKKKKQRDARLPAL